MRFLWAPESMQLSPARNDDEANWSIPIRRFSWRSLSGFVDSDCLWRRVSWRLSPIDGLVRPDAVGRQHPFLLTPAFAKGFSVEEKMRIADELFCQLGLPCLFLSSSARCMLTAALPA